MTLNDAAPRSELRRLVALARTTAWAISVLAGGDHAAAQSSTAAPPNPAPAVCTGPEFRQMDFWLGHWNVRWDASPGTPAGSSTNSITRSHGGCVVQEDFVGGPSTGGLLGRSVSVYHATAQRWRQTWVDNQGGYFALVGGPEGDRFVLVSSRLKDGTPAQRMVFEAITNNSLTWRWQAPQMQAQPGLTSG